MGLDGIEESLRAIEGSLKGLEERRERILKGGRELVSLSSKAIALIHAKRLDEADSMICKAEELLSRLKGSCPEGLRPNLIPYETELVEAKILVSILKGEDPPKYEGMGVEPQSYILGILDAIGEMKRAFYDSLKVGDLGGAGRIAGLMDGLYTLLSPFTGYSHVIQGVKRKIDVARYAVEDVMGTLVLELRRDGLIRSIEELSDLLSEV